MPGTKRIIISSLLLPNYIFEMLKLCLTGIYLLLNLPTLFAQEFYQNRKLVKVWETPEGLNVPESAFYYAKEKTIYVSNICGMHNVKDTVGFISKLNDKGEFIEKEWVRGLDAPKGIGISKGKLYVTNIDEVVEVDLKTARILKRYKNSKVVAVNDVAVDAKGNVYV